MKNNIIILLIVISLIASAIAILSILKIIDMRECANISNKELIVNKIVFRRDYDLAYAELRKADVEIQSKIDNCIIAMKNNENDQNLKYVKEQYENLLTNVLNSMVALEKSYKALDNANDNMINCNEYTLRIINTSWKE